MLIDREPNLSTDLILIHFREKDETILILSAQSQCKHLCHLTSTNH